MNKITDWLTFRRPRLAICAALGLMFILAMLLMPHDHVQKFAWMLASGIAFAYLSAASKFMKQHYSNLAVLLFATGLVSLVAGVALTPASVYAAVTLENAAAPIIGGVAGFFASASEDE